MYPKRHKPCKFNHLPIDSGIDIPQKACFFGEIYKFVLSEMILIHETKGLWVGNPVKKQTINT